MIVKSEHTVEEILEAIDAAQKPRYNGRPFYFHGDKNLGLKTIRMISFKINGTTCKYCGIAGTIFRKEKHSEKVLYWHLNLYARHKNGHLVLMTRDHIIPTSKGGPNTLENSQTLCRRCNGSKADSLPGESIYKKPGRRKRLTWNIWKRRFWFFTINTWQFRHLMWPSRANSDVPTITSFWRF